jgi:hypothetical protein
LVTDCCYPRGGSGENGDALPAVAKTPKRRTTLQSQLSKFEDEDSEKARAAADAMSPVQVSGSLGSSLELFLVWIHHHWVALFHLVIAKERGLLAYKEHYKIERGQREPKFYLNDNRLYVTFF